MFSCAGTAARAEAFGKATSQSRLCSVSLCSQTVLQDALRSDAHALPPATNADFRNFPRRRVVPRTPGSGTRLGGTARRWCPSPFRGTHTIHTPSHTVHTPSPSVIRMPRRESPASVPIHLRQGLRRNWKEPHSPNGDTTSRATILGAQEHRDLTCLLSLQEGGCPEIIVAGSDNQIRPLTDDFLSCFGSLGAI